MLKIFEIIQIIFSVILIIFVLLQVRGSGLSSSFGSTGGEFFRARRGIEKVLYYATIIIGVLFVACTLVITLLINK